MTKGSSVVAHSWDRFDVYLFDIDGTLLHCADAVHYFAFCSVLESIAGRPVSLDGVVAHGNTDIGIVRDAFVLAGVRENAWRQRLPEIKQAMCDYVRAREEELCVSALTGVREVLEHLRGKGAMLGVATGNLEAIGRLKLKRAGLLPFFQFGCWSDACENRAEVFRAALAQSRSLAEDGASICVIGDTPADIAAAHQNGLPIIAVATGIYSADVLSAEAPELCVSSLEELLGASQSFPA
jgi:phosphoglycolate phosphatase-like HAD superfamily hydrolase